MADGPQEQAPDRGTRSVPRLLVYAGTALAGFTVAWIFGTGLAAAASDQPDESSLNESVRQVGCLIESDSRDSGDEKTADADQNASIASGDEAANVSAACADDGERREENGREQHGERTGSVSVPKSLLDLGRHADGATAAAEEPESSDRGHQHHVMRETLKPVADGVDRIAERAQPVLRPVSRAAHSVVSGVTGRRPLPEAVDSGVGALGESLHGITGRRQVESPQQPPETPVLDANEQAHGDVAQSMSNAGQHEPATAVGDSVLESFRATSLDHQHVGGFDHGRVPFTVDKHRRPRNLPPFVPSCNCGGDANTSGASTHAGLGLGAAAPADHRDAFSKGVLSRARTRAIADSSGPQPGTTPD